MYHSAFYEMLYRENALPAWRRLLKSESPDLHMKDVEIILRGFAMLIDGDEYAPSMVKFLNIFSRKCRKQTPDQNEFLGQLFESFLVACSYLADDAFINKKNGRFNVALFEAAFAAACRIPFATRSTVPVGAITQDKLRRLEYDPDFLSALTEGTTQTKNVETRLKRARIIFDEAS